MIMGDEYNINFKINISYEDNIAPNIPLILKNKQTNEIFIGASDDNGVCEIIVPNYEAEYTLDVGNKYYWTNIQTIIINSNMEEMNVSLIKAPIATVNVTVNYGLDKLTGLSLALVREDTGEEFYAITDEDGKCTIEVYNSLDVEFGVNDSLDYLKTSYLIEVKSDVYDSNQNSYAITDENNQLQLQLIKLDDCKNQILTNKNCKYFYHEPYMTPNNYDIYFNQASIPANVIKESPQDLLKRLQRTMPLTKILHLNLETEQNPQFNQINLYTKTKIKFQTPDDSIQESRLRITGIWKDNDEQTSEQISTTTFEVYYLHDGETPIKDVKIKLINLHYPLNQFTKFTDTLGKCTFENLPYGTYVQVVTLDEYKVSPINIEINQEEQHEKILIGNILEDDTLLNIYITGILTSHYQVYENGECTYNTPEVNYSGGIFSLGTTSQGEDEDPIILLTNTDFKEISDFTEFDVNIIGANNEIVDVVKLNFMNNYTGITKFLPIYDGETIIEYRLDSSQLNCEINQEYLDLTNLITKEVELL